MNTVAADAIPASYPLHRRVLDTFASPGRLFEYFREHTPWIGPLAITMAVGIAVVMLLPAELYIEQAQEAMRERAQGGASGPDPETIARYGRIFGALGVLIAQPVTAFIIAGILTLIFSVLLGGEARYAQYLTVTTHALLITALGAILTLPLQIAAGSLELQLSLSLLAPFLDREGFVYRILNGLNVFTIWALVVCALGVSTINRRTTWMSAAAILLGVYVALLVVIATISAAMGG